MKQQFCTVCLMCIFVDALLETASNIGDLKVAKTSHGMICRL